MQPDYHKPTDKPDKVNYKGETEIILYPEKLVKATESQKRLKFKKTGILANTLAVLYTISEFIGSITN